MTTTETTIIRSPRRGATPTANILAGYSCSTTPAPLSPSHTDVFTPFSPLQYVQVDREGTPTPVSKFAYATPETSAPDRAASSSPTKNQNFNSDAASSPPQPPRSVKVLSYHIPHPDSIPHPVLRHPPVTTFYVVFVGQEVGVFDDW